MRLTLPTTINYSQMRKGWQAVAEYRAQGDVK